MLEPTLMSEEDLKSKPQDCKYVAKNSCLVYKEPWIHSLPSPT